jgi:putative Mg2+ transporter-C (MgtC) family protein
MQLFDPDLLWPIVGAVVAGGLIGIEREYRASPAGFRTHILVCLSSALLMLAAVHQVRWLTDTPNEIIRIDPVRMAHGILTGIGFLCGGVIFREGFTVRGLTTAASLWSTAALGVLFGVGVFGLAIMGALATLAILAAVRLTEALLPQRSYADLTVRYRTGSRVDIAGFRLLVSRHGLRPQSIHLTVTSDAVEFGTIAGGYNEARGDALAAFLRADGSVIGFECRPRTP